MFFNLKYSLRNSSDKINYYTLSKVCLLIAQRNCNKFLRNLISIISSGNYLIIFYNDLHLLIYGSSFI